MGPAQLIIAHEPSAPAPWQLQQRKTRGREAEAGDGDGKPNRAKSGLENPMRKRKCHCGSRNGVIFGSR
jgi:hypothetical protein